MRIIRIRATIEYDVPYEDDESAERFKESVDVNNECIECGWVGSVFQRIMDYHDARGACWGCATQTDMEVISDHTGEPPYWMNEDVEKND